MKNFVVITNAFKDEGMIFSNEIAEYMEDPNLVNNEVGAKIKKLHQNNLRCLPLAE